MVVEAQALLYQKIEALAGKIPSDSWKQRNELIISGNHIRKRF